MKPIIIIPCYNHTKEFSFICKKLLLLNKTILVIDDGSDRTQEKKLKAICKKYHFLYIRNKKNSGKGASTLIGFKHAKEMGFTHAIQIDADGQHDIADIRKFIDLARKNKTSVIVGDPIYDDTAPKSRLIGRKITRFWVFIETFKKNMPDSMCGFRLYPLKELEDIIPTIKFKRMGFDTEILVKLYRKPINIISIPTKVTYPNGGASHFNVWRDNLHISLLHTYLCCLIPVWLIKRITRHV